MLQELACGAQEIIAVNQEVRRSIHLTLRPALSLASHAQPSQPRIARAEEVGSNLQPAEGGRAKGESRRTKKEGKAEKEEVKAEWRANLAFLFDL